MIQGIAIQELADRVRAEADAKHDYLVNVRRIDVAPSEHGVTVGVNVNGATLTVEPNRWAHQQIAAYQDIPWRYYERMLRGDSAGDKVLLCENVSHWFEHTADDRSRRLLRTFHRASGTHTLRAFLSDRYRAIDHSDLAEIAVPILEEPGWTVKSAQITDQRLYIQAVSERGKAEVAVGDVVQAGVVISNSETGAGRLLVEPMVYRLRCTNGMIAGEGLRRTHVCRTMDGLGGDDASEYFSDDTKRLDDMALIAKVVDAVRGAVNEARFHAIVDKMRNAATVELPEDPDRVMEVTASRLSLSDAERKAVLYHLLHEGDGWTAYGLSNAVTRTAQDAEDYDRAIELERLGSRVLAFRPGDFRASRN